MEKQKRNYIADGYACVLKSKSADGKEYIKGVCLSRDTAYEMLECDMFDAVADVPLYGKEEDKELLERLNNPPQFEPFDSEEFMKIGEQAQKTAQLSHELEMKRIKAKLIADLCLELVKTPIRYEDVVHRAREIADKALENL